MTPDSAEIRRILPHGGSMILLDRVESMVPGVEVRAVKAVSATEACFAGLGGDTPYDGWAYPSSLVVESFGQAAAVLWWHSRPAATAPTAVPLLAVVRRCRFPGRAYPGDVLRHHVHLDHISAGAATVSGHTAVGRCIIAVFDELVAVAGIDTTGRSGSGVDDSHQPVEGVQL